MQAFAPTEPSCQPHPWFSQVCELSQGSGGISRDLGKLAVVGLCFCGTQPVSRQWSWEAARLGSPEEERLPGSYSTFSHYLHCAGRVPTVCVGLEIMIKIISVWGSHSASNPFLKKAFPLKEETRREHKIVSRCSGWKWLWVTFSYWIVLNKAFHG